MFTEDQVNRILASLRRRFLTPAAVSKYGATAVRLGTALKAGTSDPSRPYAARFEVPKKYKRMRAPREALPVVVKVRLKEGNKFRTVTLPTDVLEAAAIVPSGRQLVTPIAGGSDAASSGVLVSWRVAADGTTMPLWAVLTVGHACVDPALVGGSAPVIVRARVGHDFSGILVARTQADGLDAALVRVAAPNLTQDGIPVTPPEPVLTIGALFSNPRRSGLTLNPYLPTFQADLEIRTLPQPWPLGVLGEKQRIVEAKSPDPNAFAPMSSGSVWVVTNDAGMLTAAFMQLATLENDFSVGYGQVLDGTVVTWAEEAATVVSSPLAVVPGSFQFVRGF